MVCCRSFDFHIDCWCLGYWYLHIIFMGVHVTDIREIIASGVQLTKEQDDEAYALLSPEEYYAIPETQKPSVADYAPLEATAIFHVQSLHNLQNDWCVYCVNDVYLGCCKLSQLLMIPDVARSSTFKALVPSNLPVTVTLLGQFDSDTAALQHRDTLAAQERYVTGHTPAAKGDKIRCVSDGSTFPNVPAAAAHYSISVQSVYNSINGVRDAPRGLNFQRL